MSSIRLVEMLEEMKTCGVHDYRGEARKTQGRPHPITPVIRSLAVKSTFVQKQPTWAKCITRCSNRSCFQYSDTMHSSPERPARF